MDFVQNCFISFFWFLAERLSAKYPKIWPKKFFLENFFSSLITDFRFLGKFSLTIFLVPAFLRIGSLVFSDFWHKGGKWQCSKSGTEPDFPNKFSSGWRYRKYAGKTGFWAFSRDFIISFFSFFAQRCVLGMPKTWRSHVIFFPLKMLELCRKSPLFQFFHLTFFLIILVLFLSDFHHQVGPFSTLLVSLYFVVF